MCLNPRIKHIFFDAKLASDVKLEGSTL